MAPIKRSVFVVLAVICEQDIDDVRVVICYFEREPAEQHAKLANDEAYRIYKSDLRYREFDHNLYDPWLKEERWTSKYKVVEAPFVVHVDEYLEAYTKQ